MKGQGYKDSAFRYMSLEGFSFLVLIYRYIVKELILKI